MTNYWRGDVLDVPESSFIDSTSVPSPGSKMRAKLINTPGLHRISRRDSEWYSIQIQCGGSWGRLEIYDGTGRLIWAQPSTFTGSFVHMGYCEKGIVVANYGAKGSAAVVIVNYRELGD